jgi:hypothetical protein
MDVIQENEDNTDLVVQTFEEEDMLPEIPFRDRVNEHARRTDFDESLSPRQRAFLKCYSVWPSMTRAAEAADVSRRTHYSWLNNPVYAEAFQEAQLVAAEFMEDEAWRRGVMGWMEPLYQQGKRVGIVRRYDGNLLKFLLQGNMRQKYGDKVEITTKGQPLVKIALPRGMLDGTED